MACKINNKKIKIYQIELSLEGSFFNKKIAKYDVSIEININTWYTLYAIENFLNQPNNCEGGIIVSIKIDEIKYILTNNMI